MLKRLKIRGLLLLPDLSLELGPGLTVISGETGAGKSLLLSALSVLAGKALRMPPARAGSEPEIEAVLEEPASDSLAATSVRCTLAFRGGRARAEIDQAAVSVAELRRRAAGSLLLTAQGAAKELSSPEAVLAVLDTRANNAELLAEYREQRRRALDSQQRAERLLADVSRDAGGERLLTLLEELEAFAPRAGEYAELTSQIEFAASRQQYLELCARVENVISTREPSLDEEVAQLLSAVHRAPAHPAFDELARELGVARSALEAASRKALRIAEELDADPARLGELEARRDELERLATRAACVPVELAERTSELASRRQRLLTLAEELEQVKREHETLVASARNLAAKLHERRLKVTTGVVTGLRDELRALSLDHAELDLALEYCPETLLESGQSRLRVGFAANPGQALGALSRVASGGERSRFVLALACLGAPAGRTLVFDEIDQGVGGEALMLLAERLARLAKSNQVLCVTHQAAIAARADAHFLLEKRVRDGRATTLLRELGEEARTLELSRMLAGRRAGEGARALARRLLAEARRAA